MTGLSSSNMDFREVAKVLQGSRIAAHSIDLTGNRVEVVTSPKAMGAPAHSVCFEGVTALKWSGASPGSSLMILSVVGLEKLGVGEPWRLYISTAQGAELELTCRAAMCDGAEVTGVGRSYCH